MNNKIISCKMVPKKEQLQIIDHEEQLKLKKLGITIGNNVQLHPKLLEALLAMPAGQKISIGNNSIVHSCTLIGEVTIGQGCTIKTGTKIKNSTLLRNVSIGQNAEISETTIHSGIRIGSNSIIDNANIKWHLKPNTLVEKDKLLMGEILKTKKRHPKTSYKLAEEDENLHHLFRQPKQVHF